MPENFQIKRLTLQNLPAFFNLRLESLLDSPKNFLSSYEEEKAAGLSFFENILKEEGAHNVVFGAFSNDDLIGIVGVYQLQQTRIKHKANVWGIYVTPQFRKYKIGKKLMETVIDHAKNKMGCNIIDLTVAEDNLPAKKMYESFGFKIWGIEPKGILIEDQFFDEIHMSLVLAS